jgi:ketosteroid isomerase-like protein
MDPESGATPGEKALGNIGYVRRLWEAFVTGGVAAMAALVPPEVQWRPSAAGGRTLHGTEELERFWGSREVVVPTVRMFHGRGDDVLVEAEYQRDDESVRTVWLLYRFTGATLVEAIAFPNEAQARAYEPPPTFG